MKQLPFLLGLFLFASGTILFENNIVASQTVFDRQKSKIFVTQEIDDPTREVSDSKQLVETVDGLEMRYVITDKYANGYRVELNIFSREQVDNWRSVINIPEGHQIIENYGVLLSEPSKTGSTYNVGGDEWNDNLSSGENAIAVLIIQGDPNRASLSFSEADNSLGEPVYSSFTKEDRQAWRAEN